MQPYNRYFYGVQNSISSGKTNISNNYYHIPHSYHYAPHGLPPNYVVRQFPDVDATRFRNSAEASKQLLNEANLLATKISESREYAQEIKSAAQQSDNEKVEQLVRSVGIHSRTRISFTPDNLEVRLSKSLNSIDCCHFTISLRW